MGDAANVILAASAIVGVVATLVGLGFGYGAFKGRSSAIADQQKSATYALHSRLDHFKQELERHERILSEIRDVLMARKLMIPTGTQPGVRNPLLRGESDDD